MKKNVMKTKMIYRTLTATPFKRNTAYKEIGTCWTLSPYIRCFWDGEYDCADTGMGELSEIAIPDTCVDIIYRMDEKTILACAAFITIDPDSFPVPATSSPSHSEKIRWITFCTGLNAPSSVRFGQNKKAAVCLNSPIYHIFLTGTAEVCTDQEPTAIAPIGGWIKRIFIQLTHHCYWEDLSVK